MSQSLKETAPQLILSPKTFSRESKLKNEAELVSLEGIHPEFEAKKETKKRQEKGGTVMAHIYADDQMMAEVYRG